MRPSRARAARATMRKRRRPERSAPPRPSRRNGSPRASIYASDFKNNAASTGSRGREPFTPGQGTASHRICILSNAATFGTCARRESADSQEGRLRLHRRLSCPHRGCPFRASSPAASSALASASPWANFSTSIPRVSWGRSAMCSRPRLHKLNTRTPPATSRLAETAACPSSSPAPAANSYYRSSELAKNRYGRFCICRALARQIHPPPAGGIEWKPMKRPEEHRVPIFTLKVRSHMRGRTGLETESFARFAGILLLAFDGGLPAKHANGKKGERRESCKKVPRPLFSRAT